MRKIVSTFLLLFTFMHYSARATDTAGHKLVSVVSTFSDPIDNPDNWKMKVFYFSRSDERLFPPKRDGMGWTVNFANPLSVGAFVLILIAIWYLFGRRKKVKNEVGEGN